MIYVFGDSHALKFVWHCPTRWIAGLTCHGFCGGDISVMVEEIFNLAGVDGLIPRREVGWNIFANEFLPLVGKEDAILFVLGEPDCRIQFYYHYVRDGIPLQTLVNATVKRYMDFLNALDYRVGVLDVIPAINQDNVYEFDHYADRSTRAGIAVMFNGALRLACLANHIPFLSLWDMVADENGFLIDEYATADYTHIRADVPELMAVLDYQLEEAFGCGLGM